MLCSPRAMYAQVNTGELEKSQGQQVEFQNYTGPSARVDSRSQIRGIGYDLGTGVKAANGAATTRRGTENRYFVIHAVSDPGGTQLDADIFGLGPGVGVDHIRNLRLIIQGYLEGAYNYSAQDAALLAEYITIYNAVFRGDWTYFNASYKRGVLQYLTPEKAGLSTRFSEWPGNTLMVIPLGKGSAGSLSAIDTSSLSDPKVIDKMREDEDSGADRRTAMADLKDREADQADESARRQREALAAEEARIAAEREALTAEQERLARERDAASRRAGSEEAARIAAELAAQQEALNKRQQELADQERALAEQRDAARREADFANQKRAEAEQDRQSIARDQGEETEISQQGQGSGAGDQEDRTAGAGGDAQQDKDRPDGGDTQAQTGSEGDQDTKGEDQAGGFIVREDSQIMGILGMVIAGSNAPLGYIVKVHPSTGRELQRSSLNAVNIRTLVFINNNIFVLAAQEQPGNGMRLVEIDPNTLEITKQGDSAIHRESLLWVKGNNLYAIISSGANLYLARFDTTTLTLQAQSTVAVHPYAGVNFQGDMLILTQRTNGQVLLLDPVDLTEGR